ncbi:YcxB family protein [Salibacterium salarium]|uniref:YcxB family protein n=1 Tax=Salibacterium salarium TaxID=284579 RepID=A0A3R9Q7E9_9BACI|nr:YcxB family protein [Salibacterium salarium]RSL35271.1 YcxB family protein [Salibacterium salarium]
MTNEEIDIKFHGTPKINDFRKYYMYHTKNQIYYGALFFFLFVFFGFNIFFTWLGFVVIFFLALIVPVILMLFYYVGNALQAYRQHANTSDVSEEVFFRANKQGLYTNTKKVQGRRDWEDFLFIYEHKDLFRLYWTNSRGIMIPKRYFYPTEELRTWGRFFI